MNRRQISIHLNKKHKDFLASIDDAEIRTRIDEDAIITGGCIASLLLNEKVNDYDYYFVNKRTALAVAKYFANKFIELRVKEEKEETSATHPEIYVVDKNGERCNENNEFDRVRIKLKSSGIAGINTESKNYKYFEQQENEDTSEDYLGDIIPDESIEELVEKADKVDSDKLEENLPKYQPVYLSDNAITLSGKVQIIIRFTGEPKELHKNFDFVHCTNYYIPKQRKLILQRLAMESLLNKELKYIGSLYPVCSCIRIRKFLKNNWHINAGQILKICLQISELNLKDMRVLEDQLTGVDTAYFSELINKLKAKQDLDKDFIPDMPYIATLIDRIFG